MNEWEFNLLEDKTQVANLQIAGVDVKCGDRVRLRPGKSADIFDMALAGKTAVIEAIEQDYEGKFHICVVADDDPGRDIGMMRQPGHRFFFFPEEIEPLGSMEPAQPSPAASAPAVLIACIGNIFLGDDGFGVEVARRLFGQTWPAGVQVTDFGIRGLDLAYALMLGPGVTILVDACPRGETPGTVYVIEPDLSSLDSAASQATLDAHSMNPMSVLRMAKSMGGELKRILLLGCEPETLGPEEGQMGLSEPVAVAVGKAVRVMETLIPKILNGEWPASAVTT